MVKTPLFMPVATQASVKTLTPKQLQGIGVEAIICNAYHLALRPGAEVVRSLGGLHRFMGWRGTIVTDSGGFQVFSLNSLNRVSEEGVEFCSPYTGERVFLSPERVMEIQSLLGSDIVMPLDHCMMYPCTWAEAHQSVQRTYRWTGRCRKVNKRRCDDSVGQSLFGIVQGSVYKDLRLESLKGLVDLELEGYAIGGLSVGEGKGAMLEVVQYTAEALPQERPKYLMGVGTPEDILEAVTLGVDMFDCVLPTRNGRNGTAFTKEGKIKILNSYHKEDPRPLEEGCSCYTCTNFSRAYLRHLFLSGEILAMSLLSLHNLHFFQCLMRNIQEAILAGTFSQFKKDFLCLLNSKPSETTDKRAVTSLNLPIDLSQVTLADTIAKG